MVAAARSTGLDMWLAFVAGEQVWADPDEPPSGPARTAAVVELAALATVICLVWLMHVGRNPPPVGLAAWAAPVGTVAAAALATRPARVLVGRRREARLWISVAWRSLAGIAVVASLLANAPQWGTFVVAPFGIAAGAEAVLCAWAIGFSVRPLRWFWGCIVSPLNVGVVAGLVAIAVWTSVDEMVRKALPTYAMMLLTLAVGCLTAWALNTVRDHQHDAERQASTEIASVEHRRVAHWLHDDVAAELRIITLRLQNGDLDRSAVVGMLDALDHRLRLRQLDQLLRTGSVRLAEILQPYVRDAQRHGLNITAVPTFDDASLVVDGDVGRLFARSAAVLTSNAIQAGATELGFVVHHDDQAITLAVSDDAGGFDLAAIPAGRGLWQLRHELGPGGIDATPAGAGTTVTITIPLDRSHRNVEPAAR